MAEFEDPTALVAAHRAARTTQGYRRMDAYSPFPIEELHEALGVHHTRLPLIVLIGGLFGCLGGYGLQYWVVGDRVSAERRRQAAPQLAGVHPGHLRVHDSRRRAVGGARHAGAERAAAAVSPGVQRAAVRAGEPQPVLPLHRGARPEVRPRGDARVPRDARSAGGDRPLRTENGHRTRSQRRPVRLTAFAGSAVLCYLVPLCRRAGCLAAARTCTISRSTSPLASRRSSPTIARRGRSWPARSRAASCDDDALLYTGKIDGADATVFPFPVDERVMARGQERFNIYLLAVPRPHRPGRRHGRAARLPPSAVVRRGPAARGAGRPFLRRDHATASARCPTTRRRSPPPIAGRSPPTSARCS